MSSAMSEKRQQKINTLILTDLARQSIIDLLKSAYTYGWIDSYDHFRVAQLEADTARLARALRSNRRPRAGAGGAMSDLFVWVIIIGVASSTLLVLLAALRLLVMQRYRAWKRANQRTEEAGRGD